MRLYIISALVIAFLAILFALQNNNLVTINLLVWSYRHSLALVLLGTLAIGVIIGLLVSIPAMMRRGWRIARFQKQTDSLTDLVQEREQSLSAETRKIQSVHHSYRALLDTLDLIEPTTGLLKQSLLEHSLINQFQQFSAPAPTAASLSSLSLLLLQVTPAMVDGAGSGALPWREIAEILQRHASERTWLYSDGHGLYGATTPGLDPKTVSSYGEMLQNALLEHPPTLGDGHQVDLTVSLGGAIATAPNPGDVATLLNTAQVALEQAQQRGQNRLRVVEIEG